MYDADEGEYAAATGLARRGVFPSQPGEGGRGSRWTCAGPAEGGVGDGGFRAPCWRARGSLIPPCGGPASAGEGDSGVTGARLTPCASPADMQYDEDDDEITPDLWQEACWIVIR